jgi:hypothetical protein
MTDSPQDPAQALWQSQSPSAPPMSLEQVREEARGLERRIARRNLREYVAAVGVVFAFGWALWSGPSAAARIGAGLIIAAALRFLLASCPRGRRVPPSGLGNTKLS